MLTQKQIDEWLADELGKIGITGWGAKIAAKLLPTRYFTEEFTINADLASIINAIPSILVDTKLFNDHETRIIYGLPRSGSMNPVVVTVKVTAETEKSHISLCGAAKEGLIKQNTSRRVVEEIKRVLEDLAKTH
jgi:hypothetical protein